jgi:hypothetical protein
MGDWWYSKPVVVASGFGAIALVIALAWLAFAPLAR